MHGRTKFTVSLTVLILALRCELFSGAFAIDIITLVSCPVLITNPTAHCRRSHMKKNQKTRQNEG